ncbi:MAG: Acyclic terpene utilization AtuA family protein, partial [Actinomycetota bacterium]|nr:Acyclic terpene utilization AtuA family protein [Actinomycetota bacterium]
MTGAADSRRPVRIANCSGFYGDRLSAAREMVDGGPIDVLTGDWLAELTMTILARSKLKGGRGYAGTFVTQVRDVLAECVSAGIRIVSNAGGLDPEACAAAIREFAADGVKVAVVSGDDLTARVGGLLTGDEGRPPEPFLNLDTGEAFDSVGWPPLTANAYLGSRGVAAALAAGADVVVTGRITDAALVVGPAAWWHGWELADPANLDAIAGAVVAGHVIECGAQATGGNYAFFTDVPGLEHPGFPIAEVAADGTSVIT